MTLKKMMAAGLLLLLVAACGGAKKEQHGAGQTDATDAERTERLKPRYAEGFSLRSEGGVWLVDIQDPQKEDEEGEMAEGAYRYAFVPRGSDLRVPEGYERIEIPVRKVVCMTTLQLSNFIALDRRDLVAGLTSTRHLFDPQINAQLKDGRTRKIGIEGNFDTEVVMGIAPDVILISPFKRGGYEALKETGAPLIPHLGYKELTPLGQAEWIKFVGLLTGNEDAAIKRFDEIEKRYNELKALTADVKERPVVFSGEMRGGNWYAVGGKSFLARQFEDAGADYFLKDDPHSGGFTLDFETVYAQAVNARFWRIINHLHSGLLYRNEVFRPLRTGDRATGYIKEVREDDKIDVSLYPLGYDKIDGIADRILEALQQNGGALPVHDKSDADEIRALFGCSKKSFKQAVGALYKRHLIIIEPAGLRLVAED